MLKLYLNIKRLREERGLSQDTLAKLTGYTDRSSITKIEKGQVDLQQSKIELFAKALGTTSRELMGWDEEDPNIQNRDADLEAIEKILSADGYALCCESYDDDYFYIKDFSGKTVAGLYDYELLPRYDYLKKKGTVTAEMLISTAFTLYPEEKDHIQKYRDLDLHGKEMVDFTLLKEWERSTAEKPKANNLVPMAVREDATYVNAAHADDYASAPEELKQLEEDIMDDENF